MKQYDVAVIGGGPAGYLAAERASEAGLSTLLVEKREVGGVCLNEGCIPTKTLLYSGKLYEYASGEGKTFGVTCRDAQLHHEEVVKRKETVIKTLVGGVSAALKRKKADVVYAKASIRKETQGFVISCESNEFLAKTVILATGSEPVIPGIPGVSEGILNGSVLTSREILDLKEIPKELVIVGAGVIGIEMAAYFNIAGSRVTVVEMLEQAGGSIDKDAAKVLQKELEKKGIRFHMKSRVCDVSNNTALVGQDGKQIKLPYDKLLMCVGRKAVTDVPGLTELGVYTERGAIVTDERCQTNIPGLYAAGDVNGKFMLAHVAYREAEVAVNNIIGIADWMDYSAIPGVIYTQPEVSFAGLTEQQARDTGMDIQIKKVTINMSGRHIAEHGMSEGFCKLVIDRKKQIIVGASLVSAYASEIIYAVTLMIQNKIPLESIRRSVFPHPTVCEIIREAVFS